MMSSVWPASRCRTWFFSKIQESVQFVEPTLTKERRKLKGSNFSRIRMSGSGERLLDSVEASNMPEIQLNCQKTRASPFLGKLAGNWNFSLWDENFTKDHLLTHQGLKIDALN
jgi:hypothetical protein